MSADAEAVLVRRAEALARPVDEQTELDTVEVLVLSVAGDRRYGVESRDVARIAGNDTLSRLPATCGQLLGVVPIAGQVVPVFDLASLLEFDSADPGRGFVVAIQRGSDVLGLLVDDVEDVTTLAERDLVSVPAAEPGASLARLMGRDGLVLLDLTALFSDHRLIVEAGRRARPPDVGPRPHSTQE